MQARVLLVLPGQLGCECALNLSDDLSIVLFSVSLSLLGRFSVAPLRQGTVQEQIGPLACLCGLAPCTSDWHIRWLWNSAVGGVALTTARGPLHRVLQVQNL